MSAAIFIIIIAVLKSILGVASIVATQRQEEAEAAQRAPVPVESAGALPGEALAPLPTSQTVIGEVPQRASAFTTATTNKTAAIDPKDLFDPAEFLVVARRRTTPQRDLFDRTPVSTTLEQLNIPDHPDEWLCAETDFPSLSIEDEIYVQRTDDSYTLEPFDS